MRKLKPLLCALLLALLIPLTVVARRSLPMDNQPLVEKKYEGWSGVLRLWIFEGWQSGGGSLSPWLNRCIDRFERRHAGVYVQPQYVDADALTSFNDSGILPPDMLLFPAGLLRTPAGLIPLKLPARLRPALAHCGAWGAATYAVPVAMGGYMWAWNAALIDRIPDTWRDSDAALAVPEPETWRRWDAALLALCAGAYAESDREDETSGDIALPGLELGLAITDAPSPSATPSISRQDALACRLPDAFDFDADAWRHFVNGEAAALPVTQREVRRLEALSEQGRGPDWRLSLGKAVFTDQLLNLGIVDKRDADAQQALCEEFASSLLSDECQGELYRASAFSVTDAASGYAAGDSLAAMDAALHNAELCAPNSFDAQWPAAADDIVREFIADSATSTDLWERLRTRLSENPNIYS